MATVGVKGLSKGLFFLDLLLLATLRLLG